MNNHDIDGDNHDIDGGRLRPAGGNRLHGANIGARFVTKDNIPHCFGVPVGVQPTRTQTNTSPGPHITFTNTRLISHPIVRPQTAGCHARPCTEHPPGGTTDVIGVPACLKPAARLEARREEEEGEASAPRPAACHGDGSGGAAPAAGPGGGRRCLRHLGLPACRALQ